jgi:hypothetical protein
MSTLLERLGLDAKTVASLVAASIPARPSLKPDRTSKANPNAVAKRPWGKNARHYSRDTLPKIGTERKDGKMFGFGTRKIDPQGRVFWYEAWLTPDEFASRHPKRS